MSLKVTIMTNREANKLYTEERRKLRKDPDFRPTMEMFEKVHLVDIELQAETNPEIWDEEFVPMFPMHEETK